MATVISNILHVARLGAPGTDRAFNRKHADWKRLAERYMRTRHPKDLAALPLHEGKAPTLYGLEMLTPEGYQAIQSERGAGQIYLLVRLCVVEIRHPDRTEKPERPEKVGDLSLAPMSWVARLQQIGGLGLVNELGTLIERRAVIGDIEPDDGEEVADPLDRFGLPPGVALGL